MLRKKSKRLIAVTAAIVLASSIASAAFSKKAANSAIEASLNTSQNERPSYSYIIKEYNGKLAVFESGSDTPFRITDLDISVLPEADRKALQNGIKAANRKELNRILEDYCS